MLGVPRQADMDVFKRVVCEVLPAHGCNTLVLLARYAFEFRSHLEVREADALRPAQAAETGRLCRAHGIRLIPKMNLLGHQSGKTRGSELGLLRAHPEFDETPDQEQVSYCRSLCPRHPQVAPFVCDLLDELIEATGADAVHVGLDEVFEIGKCPRCRGTPNDVLFAEWVGVLHDHLVGRRGVEMLMWSDRLLDSKTAWGNEWEAAANGTAPAVERVPRDIVLCDWHYGVHDDYPSLDYFAGRGFRTVVCPWREMEATEAFLGFARRKRDAVLGVLCTTWYGSHGLLQHLCGEECADTRPEHRQEAASFKRAMELW
jgi:hypothetical protein